MEDIIQRVFAILMSVLIFFLLPLYMAFEKKDDIAYAFALKITTAFVDDVTAKGYLTEEMYNKFMSDLATTGNVYDVSMEYTSKQYNPIIQIIGKKNNTDANDSIIKEYDYLERQQLFEKYDRYNSRDIFSTSNISTSEWNPTTANRNAAKAQVTYKLSERKYYTDQILDFLSGTNNNFFSSTTYDDITSEDDLPITARMYGLKDEGLLLMNVGDQFSIQIKNTNTTVASTLFNTLTLGANAGNDTKVYINYGGTIKNEEYRVDLLGDVNFDGVVNSEDTGLVDGYMNGTEKFSVLQKIAADIEKDGDIDGSDSDIINDLL